MSLCSMASPNDSCRASQTPSRAGRLRCSKTTGVHDCLDLIPAWIGYHVPCSPLHSQVATITPLPCLHSGFLEAPSLYGSTRPITLAAHTDGGQ